MSTVAVCCDDLGLMTEARRLCAAAGLEAEVVGTADIDGSSNGEPIGNQRMGASGSGAT